MPSAVKAIPQAQGTMLRIEQVQNAAYSLRHSGSRNPIRARSPHPVTFINSRPINIRRISLVPAPISINLASRMIRLKGLSFI